METTFLIPATFLIAVAASVFFILPIIDIARKKQLFDGNNHLKRHAEKVCSLGGIAIFSALWVVFPMTLNEGMTSGHCSLFAGSFVLFLVGVKDDLVGVSAISRLIIQLGIATLLFLSGLKVTFIPGLDISLPIWASYFLTILLMGTIVNAYNFIDGINGLASGLAFISASAFSWLFYQGGALVEAQISIALAGSILGFWFFNFGTAKIFMGDNGSTFIGVILSYLAISCLQMFAGTNYLPDFSPVTVVAVLAVPVLDLFFVVFGRLLRGRSPLKGDHTHIHHVLGSLGLGQIATCVALYVWSVALIGFSLILLPENIFLASLIFVLVAGMPYAGIYLMRKFSKEIGHAKLSASKTRKSKFDRRQITFPE